MIIVTSTRTQIESVLENYPAVPNHPELGSLKLSNGLESRALLDRNAIAPENFWKNVNPNPRALANIIDPRVFPQLESAPFSIFRCDLDPIVKLREGIFRGIRVAKEIRHHRVIFEFSQSGVSRAMITYGYIWGESTLTGDLLNGALQMSTFLDKAFLFRQPPPPGEIEMGFTGFDQSTLQGFQGKPFEELPLLIRAPAVCAFGGLLGMIDPSAYSVA